MSSSQRCSGSLEYPEESAPLRFLLHCQSSEWKRAGEQKLCCEEVGFFPPPLSLNREEMVVFVAVFGEPQGVADCNKQSHCHRSQTLTGCVSWKENIMETSKNLVPPSSLTSFQCPPSFSFSFPHRKNNNQTNQSAREAWCCGTEGIWICLCIWRDHKKQISEHLPKQKTNP